MNCMWVLLAVEVTLRAVLQEEDLLADELWVLLAVEAALRAALQDEVLLAVLQALRAAL